MQVSRDEYLWNSGVITAQGYLLEVLVGGLLSQRAKPLEDLERMRAALSKQLQFDMRVPPTDTPSEFHLEIQAIARKHLEEMLDRVKTQLASPTSSGGAGT